MTGPDRSRPSGPNSGPNSGPDPDAPRKPTRAEMRTGGMVATAVLALLAVLTVLFVLVGG